MCVHDRAWSVDETHSEPGKHGELAKPGLDAVQGRSYIEASDHDVVPVEPCRRIARRDHERVEAEEAPAINEIQVRLVPRAAEYPDSHLDCVLASIAHRLAGIQTARVNASDNRGITRLGHHECRVSCGLFHDCVRAWSRTRP